MTPAAAFFALAATRAAHRRHRHAPAVIDRLRPGDTAVESVLPEAEAREQWLRLNRVGVLCVRVEQRKDQTRVVYAVRKGVRLG